MVLTSLPQLNVGELPHRNDRTRNNIITEPHEMYRFLDTPGIDVTNMTFHSNEVLSLTWKHVSEERVPNLRHNDEVIGTYVTARWLRFKNLASMC